MAGWPQVSEQIRGGLLQLRFPASGKRDDHRLIERVRPIRVRFAIIVLFNDEVGVRPARTKRAEAGTTRKWCALHRRWWYPFAKGPLQDEWGPREIDIRINRFGVQRRGELPVTHLEENLSQTGDAGRRFQMTYIGLR